MSLPQQVCGGQAYAGVRAGVRLPLIRAVAAVAHAVVHARREDVLGPVRCAWTMEERVWAGSRSWLVEPVSAVAVVVVDPGVGYAAAVARKRAVRSRARGEEEDREDCHHPRHVSHLASHKRQEATWRCGGAGLWVISRSSEGGGYAAASARRRRVRRPGGGSA